MQIVEPSVELLHCTNNPEKEIELAGRICYKSEDLITVESNERFINMIMKSGHHSVIEHIHASFKIICSRACAQQITRHRLFSYSMESQRYCNYSKDKFDKSITFVNSFEEPTEFQMNMWKNACVQSEDYYFKLLNEGMNPEDARSVLNNSCKTELIMSGNIRSWLHFIDMRLTPKAQYEIRYLSTRIKKILKNYACNVFQTK